MKGHRTVEGACTIRTISVSVMSIKFANMTKKREGVMRCETNVITITLFRLYYLVYNLGNYAMTLPLKLAL